MRVCQIDRPTIACSGCEPAVYVSYSSRVSGGWLAPLMLIVRPLYEHSEANLKSRSDDLMVAQQARNERRPGLRIKMISSLFSSGLARSRRAKPEENKEVGCGGSLPRTAASAALSWATISPPPWGSGKANQRAALDAAVAFCLYSEAPRRRASEPERSAYAL